MSHLWMGPSPRNTSNGDYGRFHFMSNQSGNHSVHPSALGNRMVHHAHYPNCPNRDCNNGMYHQTSGGGASQGMKNYTVEYGEDAVRAALGDGYADFQAQFQKQAEQMQGGGGQTMNPQVQMMNDGKSKVAMIPVVFADDDGDDKAARGGGGDCPRMGSLEEKCDPSQVMPPPESQTSVTATDGGDMTVMPEGTCAPMPQGTGVAVESPIEAAYRTAPQPRYRKPRYQQPCGVLPPQGPPPPTPKKHIRPTYSLCGKCQKCKNLNSTSETETPVLTFPTYSPGTRRGVSRQTFTSSSNLGQSAKNFRAIRFSSSHL